MQGGRAATFDVTDLMRAEALKALKLSEEEATDGRQKWVGEAEALRQLAEAVKADTLALLALAETQAGITKENGIDGVEINFLEKLKKKRR